MPTAPLKVVLQGRRAYAALTGVFVAWHTLIYALGVRFDARCLQHLSDHELGIHWALLDPDWLQHDLFRNLLVLHSQPPLFNLLVGIALKLGHAPLVLHTVFVAGQFLMYLAMFSLLRWLGVRNPIAFLTSTAYLISPATVLYEHWVFYSLPVGVLLVLCAWMFARSLDQPRPLFIGGALVLFGCLVGIRSIFQPVFFVAAAVWLAWVLPGKRRLVLACAAVPGVCIAAWMIRGVVMFGTATSSSWFGMNVARVATEGFSPTEMRSLVASGQISPVARIEPFSSVIAYPSTFASPDPPPGVGGTWRDMPALTAPYKPHSGINYNHWAFLRASPVYLGTSLALLRIAPLKALRGVARGWLTYCFPATLYGGLLPKNVDALRHVWWNDISFLDMPLPDMIVGLTTLPLLFMLGLVATIGGTVMLAIRAPPWAALERNQRLILAFLCVVVIGFAAIACSFETGENNRMRAEIDPLHMVLLGVVVDRFLRWRRTRT